ncbi:AAA family ATPase [Rhodococcoides kyotonense]|uniref:AAA family ATPase n=1 Tax=Rhodococcoides kyotonense TaxID=398843 RepID=UPI001FE74FB3|nr:ATP-binding protein [Rhodococcus kyotonensis]
MSATDEAVDRPLMDVVVEAIDRDNELSDDAKYLVLAALDGTDALDEQLDGVAPVPVRRAAGAVREQPVGAFLTSIAVAGFRGIGPKSELRLHPAPGITIVSGRNGSGKSSFAEALEFAVTGKSYRWENKAKLWADTWRNLHHPSPCEVQIGLTIEGSEPTVVGVDWKADVPLRENTTWTQVGSVKRTAGTDALGWKSAVELHRPILSYDEIGGLVEDSPSTLHDALAKLLGLDEIADAEKRLASAAKTAKVPRQRASDELKQLKRICSESTEDRASAAATLIKKRLVDVDAVRSLATGSDTTQSPALVGLRGLATLPIPLQEQVDLVAGTLRTAVSNTVELADDALAVAERRAVVLSAALDLHSKTGTIECPVCATGTLDDAWAAHTHELIDLEDSKLARYKQGRRDLDDAHRAALVLVDELQDSPGEDRRVHSSPLDSGDHPSGGRVLA